MSKLKSESHNYAAVIIFFILMGLYVRDEMVHITLLDMSAGEYGYSRFYIVGMMLFGLYYVLQSRSHKPVIRLPKAGNVFNAFILFTFILSILPIYSTHFNLLSDYVSRLLPIIALYISYSLFQTVRDKEKVFMWLFVYAVFLGYFYVSTSFKKMSMILSEDSVSSSVYSILFLIPLLLCTKHKFLRILAIAVVGVFVVLSAKRGAFIAFLLGLVVYILVRFIMANKLKFKHILFAGLLLGALAIGLNYLKNDESLFLFSRMEGIEENGYGDRGIIYPKVFRMIMSSDLFGHILGHGYNSVIKDLGMGYSAHNDFLEIWYDFGLVGLLAYLVLWYHIIRMGTRMLKSRSEYVAPYSFMVSILFVNSMVSHIFLFNQYLLVFSVAFGVFWGLYYRELRDKKELVLIQSHHIN